MFSSEESSILLRGEIPTTRIFNKQICYEYYVNTDRGRVLVAVHGDRQKPAIVTYHDLGLNYLSFENFFNNEDMEDILKHFCVYHMNAPGQEDGASRLPNNYTYPSLDELARQISFVQACFGFRRFIGLGVGVGANILARFAIKYPTKVEALALVNCTSTKSGWLNWASFKMAVRMIRRRGMCESAVDFLLWHHFGRVLQDNNPKSLSQYRNKFQNIQHPTNVASFIEVFGKRTDLHISRENGSMQVPVLNITGAFSPYAEDTVTFNSRLELCTSAWMKISDASMVLEEEAGKVAMAFRLFLQGEGYVSTTPNKKSPSSYILVNGERRACRLSPTIRITENPISEVVAC
ncbi:protein NDRG4-like [Leptidea sinapis]|uniref:protein NDRG4-like n=1 Tax=Leptidea sinapis TaxID=189913 RepID=UPI0021377921|nr:protein NDRG4-like [Leptidea sinapis]